MTSLNINASRLSVMAAGVVGLLVSGMAPAFAQQQPPQGWFKACKKEAEFDLCNVQNNLIAQTGQLVTGVNIIEIKGKINRKVFQVTVPTGRMVPPGVAMQIDGGKAQRLDYMICFPDRCVAEASLTDQLVASLKKGSSLILTSVNFQNQQNPVKMTLEGFTGAFDGPPVQVSDIEDRQKAVNAYVTKNNEEFAKKLKEEQEKAKAAN